jgi:hypothetical protein
LTAFPRAAFSAIVIVLLLLLAFTVYTAKAPPNITETISTVQTATTTLTVTQNTTSPCQVVAGIPTPAPFTSYYLSAGVNYSGPWSAVTVVMDNGSLLAAKCYAGDGFAIIFVAQLPLGDANATLQMTATKLDGSDNTLTAAVDGLDNGNSTNAPHGSVTVSGRAVLLNVTG